MPRPKETQFVTIEELQLDPKNYRLPASVVVDDQPSLLSYLAAHYNLEELGRSMADEGFRPEEPLVAVSEGGQLIVAEGNRRLSTLRLLTSDAARTQVGSPIWHDLAAEAARNSARDGWSLDEVPVVVYANRSEVASSLGFRHVSGIVPWKAENKARYVAHLVRDNGLDFQAAARAIGSRSDAVRRQFVAHIALQQAQADGVDAARAERYFGVYYRALSNPAIRAFIGLIDWHEATPQLESPLTVPVERFRELLSWLFGEPGGKTRVITDSRQIDALGRVLADPTATAILQSERRLDEALQIVSGDLPTMLGHLQTALGRLRSATGTAHEFVGDERMSELAHKCLTTAQRLVDALDLNLDHQ